VGGGLSPAVAAVRNAARASVAGLAPGDLVLAACSGGPDSLALAADCLVAGGREKLFTPMYLMKAVKPKK